MSADNQTNDTGTPKADPNPKPGLAHDFNCTHDPCICTGTQELREAIRYRVQQEYEKYHNDTTFEYNGKDFWIEQIVWKLGDTTEALIQARIAAVLDRALEQSETVDVGSTGVLEYVPIQAIEALRKEVSK